MSPAAFWASTRQELDALRAVWKEHRTMWAIERAMYANVNFRERAKDGRAVDAPFVPEDFLGESDRTKRTREFQHSRAQVDMATAKLAKIRRGKPTPEVPAWAIGPKEELTSDGRQS